MNTKLFWRVTMTLCLAGGLSITAAQADTAWPASVTQVTSESGKTVTVAGDLAKGSRMTSLAWAAQSSMACFPATENVNFDGTHVLYATSLPKSSQMTVTVVPDDPKTDLSVYAYTIGTTNFSVPPTVTSCVSCEAGYDAKTDSNPGVSESVKLTAISNPYNVVIGVAGTKGVKTGTYKLKVEVKPRT